MQRAKRQATEWEVICVRFMSVKGLVSRIPKELLQMDKKKAGHPNRKVWAKN